MNNEPLQLSHLPDSVILKEFSQKLGKATFGEAQAQLFVENHPEILSPFEMLEFAQHVRFAKRNLINPSQPVKGCEVRIPDFTGIKFFPEMTPLIIELKSPQTRILDLSTLLLTDESTICLSQLQTAAIHIIRPEGRELLKSKYNWPIDEILGDIASAAEFSVDNRIINESEFWISLMLRMQDYGIGIIALIGNSSEFEGRTDLLELARNEFSKRGSSLVTYDELLLMNEVITDYANRNNDLYTYFFKERVFRRYQGTLFRFDSSLLMSEKKSIELQQLIHRRPSDIVCVYGLGIPPPPARVGDHVLAWRANAFFDIGMLWSRPTHLKGNERLLWAGRIDSRWFVVKERLTEPFIDEVVWYEFGPPVLVEPVFRKLGATSDD